MWHEHTLSSHGWATMGFAAVAAVLVIAAAVLWLIEILAGWPWRDRDHPLHDEVEHLRRERRR